MRHYFVNAALSLCGIGTALPSPAQTQAVALGVSARGLDVQPADLEVASANTYEYTFTRAPCDWVSRGGGWGIFPRWVCDPRWSWYGGSSSGVAATWNKRVFVGDVALTAYVAFSDWDPETRGHPFYKSPNDINITLCGDGANLDSGYCFMWGADLNTRTCILKRGRVLAEVSGRETLLPRFEQDWKARGIAHKRWWAVRAERVGRRLRLLAGNEPLLEAVDHDPIPRGSVAIWTLDNGLVVSRVRIDYQNEERNVPGPQPARKRRATRTSSNEP